MTPSSPRRVVAMEAGRPEDALAWLAAELADGPVQGVFVAVERPTIEKTSTYRLTGMTCGGIAWLGALLLKWAAEDD